MLLHFLNCILPEQDSRQSPIIPSPPQRRLARAFSDLLYTTAVCSPQRDIGTNFQSSRSFRNLDNLSGRSSPDTSRISSSSPVSSSSQSSFLEDLDTLYDLFLWGEGTGDGLLGGGVLRIGESSGATPDAFLPKALESTMVLDIHSVACGSRHAVLVTKQGEVFSWGDGSGGRLGHGVETDICNPKLIDSLSGLSIESVACGEYHTCAITDSGNLYSWGDGTHNFGLLGHGTGISHWTPKRLTRQIEDLHISFISCGPWHSAAITSVGQLFTFGDGSFGALGHGDLSSTSIPREVETLKGLKTIRISCGFWHTAAIVDVLPDSVSSDTSSAVRLFTWGNGDDGQLGHGDKASRLTPCCITSLSNTNFCKVACGQSVTVALTTLGQVYTMGRADYGQLGNPINTGRLPTCVQGKIKNIFIEEIACGAFHVAALSSKSEVYTWGMGKSGQLGHGDNKDRYTPTLVEALKNKQVKEVVCGNNFTAAICLHKCVSLADHSICSGCSHPFNFKRKRHNCYNCGLFYCKACSNKRSVKASLAPKPNKPYRVCEDCFNKLNKGSDTALNSLPPKGSIEHNRRNSDEVKEKVSLDPKPRSMLSRLASFDSFKRSEVRKSKKNQMSNSTSSNVSPIHSGSCQFDRTYTWSPSRSVFDCSEKVRVSLPGSTKHSQAASPLYKESSPSHSMLLTSPFDSLALPQVVDDPKQTSDDPTKEISLLREQVEVLASRSNFLESELEKTSSQLKEITELARDHAEKNNAAKEVIKSLMRQLKDMSAEVLSGISSCRTSDPFAENSSTSLSITST
ncbi:hypothetical protein M9H77_04951 [Catharanthus roseus]|uniref:Uncharacterized protein n=1 Tax=Catharanthus roseus TaxID=4058 RepID=A0ACC0CFH4_CATRO|nr:hypothetical protein M9H77_04951 [Catharanthus roseus]